MATFSVKDFNSTEIFFYAPSGTGVVGDPFYAGTIITGALPAGTNNIGDVDVLSVPADPFGANADASSATGSISAKLRYLAAGIAGMSSLPAGTNAIGKLASNAGVTIGAVELVAAQTLGAVTTLTGSGIAHDAADSGNPHKIGGKATTSLAGVTPVANDDRTDAAFTTDGRQIFQTDCSPEDLVDNTASNTDGTSTQCLAAQGAGIRTYLESITLSNSSSSAAEVVIKNGTTARWTFPVPANKSGVVFSWKKALRGDANAAWNFDPDGAYTTITCSMSGYKSAV